MMEGSGAVLKDPDASSSDMKAHHRNTPDASRCVEILTSERFCFD